MVSRCLSSIDMYFIYCMSCVVSFRLVWLGQNKYAWSVTIKCWHPHENKFEWVAIHGCKIYKTKNFFDNCQIQRNDSCTWLGFNYWADLSLQFFFPVLSPTTNSIDILMSPTILMSMLNFSNSRSNLKHKQKVLESILIFNIIKKD